MGYGLWASRDGLGPLGYGLGPLGYGLWARAMGYVLGPLGYGLGPLGINSHSPPRYCHDQRRPKGDGLRRPIRPTKPYALWPMAPAIRPHCGRKRTESD